MSPIVAPQKEVPIPSRMGRPLKWPFETMEIGDFFFSPRQTNTLVMTTSRWGKKLGRKFKTQLTWAKLVENKWVICDRWNQGAKRGVGCWRVE